MTMSRTNDVSPLRDTDSMPFGKHKDRAMKDVPASYLDYLSDQDWLKTRWPRVWAYIDHNRNVIDKELEDPKAYGKG